MKEETDRRSVLRCMAWAGAGAVWTVSGGIASSSLLTADAAPKAPAAKVKRFTFVQVSDSHIGFAKDPNPDARVTFREAVGLIRAMPVKPDVIIHTGDVTQLSKPEEFDDADKILSEAGVTAFHVPGEHDMLDDGQGKAFLDRYGKATKGDGWSATFEIGSPAPSQFEHANSSIFLTCPKEDTAGPWRQTITEVTLNYSAQGFLNIQFHSTQQLESGR